MEILVRLTDIRPRTIQMDNLFLKSRCLQNWTRNTYKPPIKILVSSLHLLRMINAFIVSTKFTSASAVLRCSAMVTFDNSHHQWQVHFFPRDRVWLTQTRLYPNKEKYLTVLLSYPVLPVRVGWDSYSGHATCSGCAPYIYIHSELKPRRR